MVAFISIVVLIIVAAIFQVWMNDKERKRKGKEIEEKIASLKDFVQSSSVKGINNTYCFLVDNVHKKVAYVSPTNKTVIPYEQIISVELLEEGKTTSKKSTMRTVGGALIEE